MRKGQNEWYEIDNLWIHASGSLWVTMVLLCARVSET